ncbi:MAG: roadblock/LC7 domain-containing protein [Nitrospirae bacterium]|nr:roadblock/LC7 domain-containing protein [Nitrospirota bacterium]
MPLADFVLYEEEYGKVEAELTALCRDARITTAAVIDKNGQIIATAGETRRIDATSLASLAAGDVAAANGMAALIGETEFSVFFHEGQRDCIYMSLLAGRFILIAIFDKKVTSLGMVRLKANKATEALASALTSASSKSESGKNAVGEPLFADITSEDIDRLFGQT